MRVSCACALGAGHSTQQLAWLRTPKSLLHSHRIPGPHQLGQFGARRYRLQKTTRVPGRPWRTPRDCRIALARRQLLDQQPMAQARLRQHTAALRTYILTHHARALFAAALGTSDDLCSRSVPMHHGNFEQVRGVSPPLEQPTAHQRSPAAPKLTSPCKRVRRFDDPKKPGAIDDDLVPPADDLLNFVF